MTIGIYKLCFEGTNKVYIGQSVNIEKRFAAHLYLLSKGTASKKLQTAYHLYGPPKIVILEVLTNKEELSETENSYISILDSFNHGLNSLEFAESVPLNNGSGVEGPAAIYSREQIIEVFYFLVDTNLTAIEIQEITGVSIGIVYYIKNGLGHHWLKKIDPEKYTLYIENRLHGNCALNKGYLYPDIVSPSGVIYKVPNRNKFAKEHNLDSGALGRLLRGVAKSHKGWKVCPEDLVL